MKSVSYSSSPHPLIGKDGQQYVLNLIDTPGHVDFSYEVSRSLSACEGALLVVDASQGVEAQTLANLYLALDQGLVLVPVVNKVDLPSAEPERVGQELVDVIGFDPNEVLFASAKSGIGIEPVGRHACRPERLSGSRSRPRSRPEACRQRWHTWVFLPVVPLSSMKVGVSLPEELIAFADQEASRRGTAEQERDQAYVNQHVGGILSSVELIDVWIPDTTVLELRTQVRLSTRRIGAVHITGRLPD